MPVIGGFLLLLSLSSFLRTSFTDAGIIPRATPDEVTFIEKYLGKILILNNYLVDFVV